jgi:hypothetical protein
MRRTYLALAGLAVAGSALPAALPSLGRAATLFESRPLDSSRFSILARPVADDDWNLLVLEQLRPVPRCWEPRADGLVDPALNRFDYTDICSRYLDSNGYSLRVGEDDLAGSYRLRLEQVGDTLQLQAFNPNEPTLLVVGRGRVPLRDREGFVALQLDPGWELRRRAYGGQTLNHVYFANATPLAQLIARQPGGSGPQGGRGLLGSASADSSSQGRSSSLLGSAGDDNPGGRPRTIALQVIPFQE